MNEPMNQRDWDKKLEGVSTCGRNRGPHHYIPISWTHTENTKSVTYLMCRVCFARVSMRTLVANFPEVKI